jgi:hypothetical protein
MQVTEWGEGVANWRYSIIEMLMLAKTLNATFVEPCITGGRLYGCRTDDETHNQITLSDVFIMDKLKEFYPLIVSHTKFHHETTNAGTDINATFVQRICHQQKKHEAKSCDEGTRTYHKEESMDPMMEAAIQRSHKQKTIIHIYSWKLCHLGTNRINDNLFGTTLYNAWMRECNDAGEMLEMGFVKKLDGNWMIFVRMIQGSIVGRIVGVKVVYIDFLSEGLI